MTSEFEQAGDQHFLDELDDPRLRRAVELVRASSPPDESLNRAVGNAEIVAAAASAVRRQPTVLRPARRRLAKMVVAVGVIWLIAAGIWTARHSEENGAEQIAAVDKPASTTAGAGQLYDSSISMANSNNFDVSRLPTFNCPPADNFFSSASGDGGGVFVDNGRVRTRNTLDGLSKSWTATSFDTTAFAKNDTGIDAAQTGKMTDAQRKIIQSANISLVVKQLSAAESSLNALVQKHHAEIANAQVAQAEGQQRMARWIIRVQAAALDPLLQDIAGLGVAEARSVGSQDVTEEYIDLASRIASKKKLEQRILDVLEKKAGDIKDVLAVEEQLARIRSEIESMEGRQKYLDNQAAMSTVNVVAREQAEYVAPAVDTFTSEVNRTWGNSLDRIRNFGKSLILVAVAAGPWLPIAVILCFGVFRVFKRRTLKKAEG